MKVKDIIKAIVEVKKTNTNNIELSYKDIKNTIIFRFGIYSICKFPGENDFYTIVNKKENKQIDGGNLFKCLDIVEKCLNEDKNSF